MPTTSTASATTRGQGRPSTGRSVRSVSVTLPHTLLDSLAAARAPGQSVSAQFAELLAIGLHAQPSQAPDRLAALEARVAALENAATATDNMHE
ncbi:hypothetical protein [Megalodesulfovibrio gigas]|uniref:hypothetical protein n=1 Tax=Megalodesulfovibrio gigas TaxID=879 RepID=UPI00040190EA|nr:hypothetical protein [Megalodesulfovibrio gigas]